MHIVWLPSGFEFLRQKLFNDFSFGFWNCSHSVVFFVYHLISIVKSCTALLAIYFFWLDTTQILLHENAMPWMWFSFLMEHSHSCKVVVPSVGHLLRRRPFNISHVMLYLTMSCGGGNLGFLINIKTQTWKKDNSIIIEADSHTVFRVV